MFNFINILIDHNLLDYLNSLNQRPELCILFGFKEAVFKDSLNVNLLAVKPIQSDSEGTQSQIDLLIKARSLPNALGTLTTPGATSSPTLHPLKPVGTKKSFFANFKLGESIHVDQIFIHGQSPEPGTSVNLIFYNSRHLQISFQFSASLQTDQFKEPICDFCVRTLKRCAPSLRQSDHFSELSCFIPDLSEETMGPEQEPPQTKISLPWWANNCLDYSTTGQLIHHYLNESAFCWRNFKRKQFSIRMANFLTLITIDLILSFVLVLILNQITSISSLLESCLQTMEAIVASVERLIYNLIGMPAGLKLNRPLNTALGNFFLYHIHIWKAYISLIRPFLSLVLDLLGLISFFGITFVLSFLSDLISLASIHIYCFYGYAARLHCFQLSSLVSLWRLFRGKKWNTLKSRVDSYSYGHDQLFIGTVCFTILIFLLPTILLYYVVFLFLRLITIISQLAIKSAIGLILAIPFYNLLLWTTGSRKVNANIVFQVDQVNQRQLNLSMLFKPLTLSQLYEVHNNQLDNPFGFKQLIPSNFFHSLLTGGLV